MVTPQEIINTQHLRPIRVIAVSHFIYTFHLYSIVVSCYCASQKPFKLEQNETEINVRGQIVIRINLSQFNILLQMAFINSNLLLCEL